MKKEEFIDVSYKSLKYFTKNIDLTEEEEKEINSFVNDINKQIEDIDSIKNENLFVNIGNAFKYLIEEGINKDDN